MPQEAIWVHRQCADGSASAVCDPICVDEPVVVRRVRVMSKIESRMDDLPPFPTVLSELITLTRNDRSAARDLRSCIEKDAVLTARILRLANSAFYCPSAPVTSVQQAVVMLGFLSVRSLAMAAATLKFMDQEMRAYGMPAGGLWMHSYAAAELARELARLTYRSADDQDAVYVGALLHDIGKIVLGDVFELPLRDPRNQRRVAVGESTRRWEERVLGICHCETGQRLSEKWRLAPVTASCIRHHHDWRAAPHEFGREVKMVALADMVARRLGAGLKRADNHGEDEAVLTGDLGITEDRLIAAVDSYAERAAQVERLFSNLK